MKEDRIKGNYSDAAITKVLDGLYAKEKWTEARAIIRSALRQSPDDHWLLLSLSHTYYEERRYKIAQKIGKRALDEAPWCPNTLWSYAACLDMLGEERQAIGIWKKLLRRGEKKIATGRCGEGRQAATLLNDARYRIGLAYADVGERSLAIRYLKMYLKRRTRGSTYTAARAKNKLKLITLNKP